MCRFINADGYVSTGTGFIGYNMYAYCDNNPVNMIDVFGGIPKFVHEIFQNFDQWVYTSLGELLYGFYYNGRGEKIEVWIDADKIVRWARHHGNHGNSKNHPMVPHDHRWYINEKGNNTEDSKWLPVDDNFQPPNDSGGSSNNPNNKNDNNNDIKNKVTKTVGITITSAAVIYSVYTSVKWIIAVVSAPSTGGTSLVLAGVTP